MMSKSRWRFFLVSAFLAAAPAHATAPKAHDHEVTVAQSVQNADAHVHGMWEMFAALDGKMLTVTLTGPLADLAGVEQRPGSPEEAAALEAVRSKIASFGPLIRPNQKAGCVIAAPFEIRTGHETDNHDHHNEHGEAPEQYNGHGADVDIAYSFVCETPKQLKVLSVEAFKVFKSVETIEAVFIDDNRQIAARLTPTEATLSID